MPVFNPIASSLFVPIALTFGGVLATGLAGVFAAERGSVRRIRTSVLFQRWRTWAVLGPAFALAVLAGPTVVAALVAIGAVVALLEYSSVTGLSGRCRTLVVALGAAALGVACAEPGALAIALVLILLALAAAALVEPSENGFQRLGLAFLGIVYIPVLLAHAVLMVEEVEGGRGLLLAVGLAVGLSDVGAFSCGKLFGRRPLAPRLSPNKTWAGLGGNFLGAHVAFAIMAFALPEIPLFVRILLPSAVAVAAVSGDLFESLLKRSFNVKDAGDWLPGFGGLLDRIDSLLFALPVVYYMVLPFSHGGA